MFNCRQWADRSVLACKAWADEVEQECRDWADQGYYECGEWEEKRHKDCCDWWPCSWACDAFVWIVSWVCRGWYWIAKWVCIGWTWVVRTVCVLWGWVTVTACGLWSIVVCALLAVVNAIASLFGRSPERRSRVDHIFVLMLENRSFDHMLGFSDITGRDSVTGAPTSIDGLVGSTFTNPDPNDPMNPAEARVPAAFAVSGADKDPGHEFLDVLTQLAGPGANLTPAGQYPPVSNQGFVADYTDRGSASPRSIMNCFAPRQLPVLNALAREFAVCDAWFSSLPGPTWPNRFFAHAASSGGLDDSPSGLEIGWGTLFDGFRFNNGSIFERLDEKCVDWEIVEGDEFPLTFALAGMTFNAVVRNRFTDFPDFVSRLRSGGGAPPYVFIEPHYGNVLPGTSEDFTCGNSQHPLDDVTAGEQLIKDTYEAIRNSSLWESSLLIVTWDEHGGFYDHVTPGAGVPPGDGVSEAENVHHGFRFDQLGVRVPALVISPFIARNTVDHTPYDHASIPATVERNLGLSPLTDRDASVNDVLHLLSLDTPRTNAPTSLPAPAESGFRCMSIFDLLEEIKTAPEPGTRDTKVKGGERRADKTAVPPSVRTVEILALLREMSLLRRWDARGRRGAIQRFIRRETEDQARRYIAHVRGLVRARKGESRSVPAGLRPRGEAKT
ncbi:hypothetical protein BH20ACT24_BH20ACT24_18750 [soil metagenome]